MASDLTPPAPRPTRRRGVLDAAVFLAVLAVLGWLVLRPSDEAPPDPGRSCTPGAPLRAGDRIPGDCLLEPAAGGDPVALRQLQGERPLVLNFWATWCAPCVEEMPGYQQVYAAGAGGFELLGVNPLGTLGIAGGETREASRSFADRLGVRYPLAYDPGWLLYRHFNAEPALPTTVFVRPDGVVAHVRIGPYDPAELAAGIREHLGVVVDGVGAVADAGTGGRR